jgi:DNA polymerase V
VDESFLDLSTLNIKDYKEWGSVVRKTILKNIGVPVSIGIAHSKTLAKLGSEVAKKTTYTSWKGEGVTDLINIVPEQKNEILQSVSIKDIWGVGWRLTPKLKAEGIHNALNLANMRPQHAQKLMGIHGRQLVAELNGISCYPLEREHKAAKSIMRGRTFGEDTNQAHVMESAIASMATRATYSLRCDNLLARRIGFFTETNRHKPGYRRWAPELKLTQPTNDTGEIISLLVKELGEIYSSSQKYHRLCVFLYDLVPARALQTDMLGGIDVKKHDKAQARMQAIDQINSKHGRRRIYYAAENLGISWQPKQQIRSPRYVSSWAELPEARILTS